MRRKTRSFPRPIFDFSKQNSNYEPLITSGKGEEVGEAMSVAGDEDDRAEMSIMILRGEPQWRRLREHDKESPSLSNGLRRLTEHAIRDGEKNGNVENMENALLFSGEKMENDVWYS